MEEFLEILKEADGDYWDEFLAKAQEIHRAKFTLRKMDMAYMSTYQICAGGVMASQKREARARLGLTS